MFIIRSQAASVFSPSFPHHCSTPTFDPIHSSKYPAIAAATSSSPYFISPPDSALVMCCCAWYFCIMLFITSFNIFLSGAANLSFRTFMFFRICFARSYLSFLPRFLSSSVAISVHASTNSSISLCLSNIHNLLYLCLSITVQWPIFFFVLCMTLSLVRMCPIASVSTCTRMLLSACRCLCVRQSSAV